MGLKKWRTRRLWCSRAKLSLHSSIKKCMTRLSQDPNSVLRSHLATSSPIGKKIDCQQVVKISMISWGKLIRSANKTYRGGFLPKRIYEVYGEGGTGKTQLSIQLLLNVSQKLNSISFDFSRYFLPNKEVLAVVLYLWCQESSWMRRGSLKWKVSDIFKTYSWWFR